eukprot:106044-Amorphochlora_amoeboformis.AAC.1
MAWERRSTVGVHSVLKYSRMHTTDSWRSLEILEYLGDRVQAVELVRDRRRFNGDSLEIAGDPLKIQVWRILEGYASKLFPEFSKKLMHTS